MSYHPPAMVEVEIVGASILFDVPLPPVAIIELEGFGPGPPGPTGPPGPQGPQGVPGTGGLTDWGDIVNKPATFPPTLPIPESGVTGLVADLASKEPTIAAGTTAQYWRGNKSWATLDKAAVGLGNVDNTSDAAKPISTATQAALNGKEPTITAGTTAQYWRGDKAWAAHDKASVGLGNVDNTSDAAKPISTATQAALDGKAALTHTHTASQVTDFAEAVDDRVGALLVPGANVTLTYNDAAGSLTIASTGGSGGIPEAPADGKTYGRVGSGATWNPALPIAAGTITAAGGSSITSVAQTFTGGIISVGGSPITSGAGTLALTVAGNIGGIPYFTGINTWTSTLQLSANRIVLGGGNGSPTTTQGLFTDGSGALTVGSTGAVSGTLGMQGITSGTISIKAQAAAGTYNFNMPITAGTAGQVLTSQGGGAAAMTWTSAGTGTVTSVAQTFTGGIVSVAGSPIGTAGTLALTVAGTSGGVPYFSSGTAWASSGALTSNALVLGGGAGAAPKVSTGLTTDGNSALTVGQAGTAGAVNILGSTSGTISIKPGLAAAGTYNFNMPTTAGTAGQLLTSQGGAAAAMTWTNAGAGSVTSVVGGTGIGGGTITTSGTLTNTGVLSIDTATGAILIGAGLVRNAQTISTTNTIVVGLANNLTDTLPTGTYDLGPFPQGGTILNGYAHVVSGTLTYGAAIGQPGTYTNVTGLTAVAITATNSDTVTAATAANVIAAGAHVYLKITGTAAVGAAPFLTVKVP